MSRKRVVRRRWWRSMPRGLSLIPGLSTESACGQSLHVAHILFGVVVGVVVMPFMNTPPNLHIDPPKAHTYEYIIRIIRGLVSFFSSQIQGYRRHVPIYSIAC